MHTVPGWERLVGTHCRSARVKLLSLRSLKEAQPGFCTRPRAPSPPPPAPPTPARGITPPPTHTRARTFRRTSQGLAYDTETKPARCVRVQPQASVPFCLPSSAPSATAWALATSSRREPSTRKTQAAPRWSSAGNSDAEASSPLPGSRRGSSEAAVSPPDPLTELLRSLRGACPGGWPTSGCGVRRSGFRGSRSSSR